MGLPIVPTPTNPTRIMRILRSGNGGCVKLHAPRSRGSGAARPGTAVPRPIPARRRLILTRGWDCSQGTVVPTVGTGTIHWPGDNGLPRATAWTEQLGVWQAFYGEPSGFPLTRERRVRHRPNAITLSLPGHAVTQWVGATGLTLREQTHPGENALSTRRLVNRPGLGWESCSDPFPVGKRKSSPARVSRRRPGPGKRLPWLLQS